MKKKQEKLTHLIYKTNKKFYRKHGRKPYILLTKIKRKEYRRVRKQLKLRMIKEPISIVLPEILSLSDNYRADFLQTIYDLNKYLPLKKYKCSIDHSSIKRIDPEALIVLAAEIKRSVNKKWLRFNKEFAPKNEEIMSMLNSIGYWEHFNISKKDLLTDKKRKYLKILHDTQADNTHVVNLRKFFEKELDFLYNDNAEDMFDSAISEAIANSVEHAYVKKQKVVTIDKAWWLSGYYDIDTKELFFICYDQGIGVKEALNHNDNRLVKKWVSSLNLIFKNDSDTIETLIKEDLPKYRNTDRGHGFKYFIKYIENYTNASLNIYSKKGICRLIKENNNIITEKRDYDNPLNGTLIVWKIKFDRSIQNVEI